MNGSSHIADALAILVALGLPRAQQNERSALCLLALLDLKPDQPWAKAGNPLLGITPMMAFSREHYGRHYAPNTRETFRRQTMHQFVAAGLARYNPDNPERPVNSPKAVYQIEPETRALVRAFGTRDWKRKLDAYLANRHTLAERYARPRDAAHLPVQVAAGKRIRLTPGEHSALIKAVVEKFAPRFVPGGLLIYVGDTGKKWGYFEQTVLGALGVQVDAHGKMPDVVIHDPSRNWLILVEAVTSHGPVDGKRHEELAHLFAASHAGLVFVTAFPSRVLAGRYMAEIAWETEVWVAEAPTHLIHFNGSRFLGPYPKR